MPSPSCSKSEFSSALFRAGATRKLLLRHFDENGILSDTFDLIPRNDQVVVPSKAKDPTTPADHQSKNSGILAIKFKITRIPKTRAVTQIDDLKPSQICRTASLHTANSFEKGSVNSVYAAKPDHLAVRFKNVERIQRTSQKTASVSGKEQRDRIFHAPSATARWIGSNKIERPVATPNVNKRIPPKIA